MIENKTTGPLGRPGYFGFLTCFHPRPKQIRAFYPGAIPISRQGMSQASPKVVKENGRPIGYRQCAAWNQFRDNELRDEG